MANPKNRETVEEALRSELERDRTKTYVVEISPLGLVEMTRQNVTDGPREILTNRCPVCAGDGVVVSDATHALEIERRLRAIAKGSRVQAFKVAVHPRVLTLLVGDGGVRLEGVEAASRRRFYLVPAAENGHVHLDHFEVLAQGKLETVRPDAPVEEGSTMELKLVELGLHDPTTGVGKLDGGYEVVVAHASKLVGKKVRVTVGRVLEGVAFATLVDDTAVAPTPITFEAEAEKPMRASRSKKDVEPAEADEEDVADELDEPADADAAIEDDEPEPTSGDVVVAEPDGQPKKKRTRRGTRGGRSRKKPAATPAASVDADADGDAPADEGNGRPAPRIHVPPSDLAAAVVAAEPATDTGADEPEPAADGAVGADGLPKRKRARRGSRGGKKRRKPAAEGTNDVASPDEVIVVGEAADEEAPEYVPMSEWIEDFDSRSRA
jgi:ribonuclease G